MRRLTGRATPAAFLPLEDGNEVFGMTDLDYGLELTNNSKTSWAFSMPRNKTCVSATEICKRVCYGNGVRYQTHGSRAKRERNLRTVELLLCRGGPEILSMNLIEMIDKARPVDWLTASVTERQTQTPWTIRIHDIGDFYRRDYVVAWAIAISLRPQCSFWFYTRSFDDKVLFEAMTVMAGLPNCKGWLSIDSENFKAGIKAYKKHPEVWQIALMQESIDDLDERLLSALKNSCDKKSVSFPVHQGRYYASPVIADGLFVCPAVTGVQKLESDYRKVRPCQSCGFCLPKSAWNGIC